MLLDLPTELHFSIVEKLPRTDLLALAAVCRQLNSIANDIIYRELHLCNTYPYLQATFDLLMASNGHLAGKIKRAIFTTSKDEAPYDREASFKAYLEQTCHAELWMPLGLLSRFSSLESLELHGCPFYKEQAGFVKALSLGSPALRAFVYKPNGYLLFPESRGDGLALGQFIVINLERLTWYSDASFFKIEKPFYWVLNASLASLTSISILGSSRVSQPYFRDEKIDFPRLLTIIFPALTSFSLGTFSLPSSPSDIRQILSLFLRRHPKIVDLVLKITPQDSRYEPEPWNFKRKMLPALRSLNTNFEILSELARVNMKGLRLTLQKLTITDSYFDSWADLDTMWKYITPDRFPNVNAIAFNPGPGYSSFVDKYYAWGMLKRIASAFPNARIWSSNIETDFWEDNNIVEYLSKFPHLEEVHMLRGPAITVDAIYDHPDEQEPSWYSDSDSEASRSYCDTQNKGENPRNRDSDSESRSDSDSDSDESSASDSDESSDSESDESSDNNSRQQESDLNSDLDAHSESASDSESEDVPSNNSPGPSQGIYFPKDRRPIYDPRYDIEQQSRSAHISAYYLEHLAPSCPNISSFTAHSKGWVPDGMYE